MLLLVLGFTLCAWLFTMVSNATAATKNGVASARAMGAAESGLAATMYELRNVTRTTGFKGDEAEILRQIGAAMLARQEKVAGTVTVQNSPPTFSISQVTLNDLGTYTAQMTQRTGGYTVRIDAENGEAKRAICLDITRKILFGSSSMDYAIASKGTLSIEGAAKVYRYDPNTGEPVLTDIGEPENLTRDGPGFLRFDSSAEIDSSTPPLFPETYLDEGVYTALNSMIGTKLAIFDPSNPKFNNIYIPPATGKNADPVVLPDSCVITGIVYVGWPNTISFGTNVTLNGMIIYEKPPADYRPPADDSKASPSVILLGRTESVEGTRSTENILPLFSNYSAPERDQLVSSLGNWLIHAPDTDFDLENGATSEERYFAGNFHVRTLGKSTGSGPSTAGNLKISGQILCEGNVDLGGNRVFCIRPPTETENPDADRRVRLDVAHGGYWEPR